jgi:hypothetical protein
MVRICIVTPEALYHRPTASDVAPLAECIPWLPHDVQIDQRESTSDHGGGSGLAGRTISVARRASRFGHSPNRIADAVWFRHNRATPPRNQRSFPESNIFLPEQTASTMVVIKKQSRNQVQAWPETGEAGSVSSWLMD